MLNILFQFWVLLIIAFLIFAMYHVFDRLAWGRRIKREQKRTVSKCREAMNHKLYKK